MKPTPIAEAISAALFGAMGIAALAFYLAIHTQGRRWKWFAVLLIAFISLVGYTALALPGAQGRTTRTNGRETNWGLDLALTLTIGPMFYMLCVSLSLNWMGSIVVGFFATLTQLSLLLGTVSNGSDAIILWFCSALAFYLVTAFVMVVRIHSPPSPNADCPGTTPTQAWLVKGGGLLGLLVYILFYAIGSSWANYIDGEVEAFLYLGLEALYKIVFLGVVYFWVDVCTDATLEQTFLRFYGMGQSLLRGEKPVLEGGAIPGTTSSQSQLGNGHGVSVAGNGSLLSGRKIML